MRYLILLIFFATSFQINAQIDLSVRFIEKGTNKPVFAELIIDSLRYTDHLLNNKISINKGLHKFIVRLNRHELIDTSIYIQDTTSIIIPLVISDTELLSDFQEGFYKTYYDYKNSIAIGLKKDNTFVKKSFFHISLVGCYQYEYGKYNIVNDTLLILTVDYYNSSCSSLKYVAHIYRHEIRNDSIIDFDKYIGYIEKKYFGHGLKKFND